MNQKNEFNKIIQIILDNDLSEKIILIGSWAYYLYCTKLFSKPKELSTLRTTDIDFYIPRHLRMDKNINVCKILKENGYEHTKDIDGYDRFFSQDFNIEFITDEIGAGSNKPYHLKKLNLEIVQLRYTNLLSQNIIEIPFAKNQIIKVPQPENFALHKLIIANLRKNKGKTDKDIQQAVDIIKILIQTKQFCKIKELYNQLPKKWRKRIDKTLETANEFYLKNLIKT
ncbi:hypothetical protein KA977_04120 [Candidatus Dependentiae bacterium]|nr:hypothetical protein [Candidatus Dependentiae bacterium]